MTDRDEIGATNQRHWERMVSSGCAFTQPWLDLDREQTRRYGQGQLDPIPTSLLKLYPASLLADVEGKRVLCLASGGGQQSAVFGLLGARVTVVDLTEGQLEGDRTAAAHYGYEVTTVQADMRDLSMIEDASLDLVYQAPSMAYIPDVAPVYAEVARVLVPGGLYRVCFTNPATEFVDWNSWDGQGYRIAMPYAERVERPPEGSEGSVQFRHYMGEIFNGLVAAGLSIQHVMDDPQYYLPENARAQPGTWDHWLTYVGAFAVVAEKAERHASRTSPALSPPRA
jgi:SAM-dependent methyltransferase